MNKSVIEKINLYDNAIHKSGSKLCQNIVALRTIMLNMTGPIWILYKPIKQPNELRKNFKSNTSSSFQP